MHLFLVLVLWLGRAFWWIEGGVYCFCLPFPFLKLIRAFWVHGGTVLLLSSISPFVRNVKIVNDRVRLPMKAESGVALRCQG